jgi:hypothetical protein
MIRLALLMILVASPAFSVSGDLNRDGMVDYDDFFIFADNFGKSGDPDLSSAVYLHAPSRCSPTYLYVTPQPELSPVPDDLVFISVNRWGDALNSSYWDDNFDADAEADGFSIDLDYYDSNDQKFNSWEAGPWTRYVTIRGYVAAGPWALTKRESEPLFEFGFIHDDIDDIARIPFEEFPSMPADAVRNSDEWDLGGSRTEEEKAQKVVDLFIEVEVTFRGGETFMDTGVTLWSVSSATGDYRLAPDGDPND